jgi:hypothetical protein
MKTRTLTAILILLICSYPALAQDDRTQYPAFLAKSYFNINLGYINFPFSGEQLEPGYTAESVQVPHLGVRIVFLGHRFNKYLSGQVSYWKPVDYVQYKNINGDNRTHTAWVHQGTLTLKSQLPLGKKLSLAGEAGFGIVTRKGFDINGVDVVKNASHGNWVFGAGLEYHVNKKWDLIAGTTYSTPVKKFRQPHTSFHSLGFRYNMSPLPAEVVERNNKAGYIFPKHLFQFGYTTDVLGYGANNAVSKGPVAIFWGGKIEISKGVFLRYQRNLFHTRKTFSFDVGTSAGWWQSRINKENTYTLSLYPVFRWTFLRTRGSDFYFNYCVAGPSYISRTVIDGRNSGKHFTFQDFMGFGSFIGKKRNLVAEILINHYSNGNIFPDNAGFKIPLTFNLGYAWQ